MTDGIFKRHCDSVCYPYAYARAAEVMSTQSETDFEWSVKLLADYFFDLGIASQLKRGHSLILTYDQNAILYVSCSGSPAIYMGNNGIHTGLPQQKTGDVIKFRFEPQRKKLVIALVRK